MTRFLATLRPSLLAKAGRALAAGFVGLALAAPAPAITINLDYDEDDSPSFDPDGSRLMTVARAAADFWEWHILDNREIHMDMSWSNLDDSGRLGEYHPSYVPFDSIDIVMSTHREGAQVPWFFDETPLVNEEFEPFTHKLLRDLNPQVADNAFAGPNVPLLEVGVSARANLGTPALAQFDLFTMILHEFGHALGMNYAFNDNDYDFDPADIAGLEVGAFEAPGYELVLNTALMNDSIAVLGKRTLPSATDILATHDQGDFTNYNLRRIDLFGNHSQDWNDTLNWIGGKKPEWFNDAFMRSGGSVRIGGGFEQARSLLVDEGSTLHLDNNAHLRVIHGVTVGNAANNTRGEIHVGNLNGNPLLEVESMNIDNGLVRLASQAAMLAVTHQTQIAPKGVISGLGVVEAHGELNNDGEISAGILGIGGDLLLRALGNGKLDLDGGTEPVNAPADDYAYAFPGQLGNEWGKLSAVNGSLRVLSPLADSFNGTATIGPGREMAFYQPWGFGGELIMRGGVMPIDQARLTGAEIQLGGNISLMSGGATIDAPIVTGMFTKVYVHDGSRLNLLTSKLGPATNPLAFQGSLTLGQYAILNVEVPGASWTNNRSLKLGPGAVVAGDNIINAGRVEGGGLLTVERVDNNGVFAPTGELQAGGHYAQSSTGKLEIDLGGFTQGVAYDVLRSSTAQLAGAVALKLADGFLPGVGSQFEILTASYAGSFSSLQLSVPQGVQFTGQLVYNANRVVFQVTQAAFTGDFDSDGDVDGSDLVAWTSGFTAGTLGALGDLDGDSDTDGADFLAMQRQLGRRIVYQPTGGDGSSSFGGIGGGVVTRNIPEPASAVLALGGLAAALVASRRSRATATAK